MRIARNLFAAGALFAAGSAAQAQSVEQFYAGKTINVIVPFSAGGIYDTTGRLVARNMGQYIPGKPTLVVQNQPSGGGIGLANRFAAGESDGTLLGTLQRGLPQLALTGDPNVRFDPLKLTWIGSLSAYATDSYILAINASHPLKRIEDLRGPSAPLLRIGSNRAGSTNLTIALVVQHALGLKHEIVRGYPGAADINLAQQRGEVDGQYADLSFFQTNMRDIWEKGGLRPLVQTGRSKRLASLPDVPLARELTQDPAMRALLEFAEMPFEMALPVAAPAQVPKDRADALKKAFNEMGKDPGFLADAKKMNFLVDPISGDEVLAIIRRAAQTPRPVIDLYKKLIEQ
ncbi:MAG: Bug family tripartite tricarboxylate transporter substrate binding protein [Beijerinckiaceae bacterium]